MSHKFYQKQQNVNYMKSMVDYNLNVEFIPNTNCMQKHQSFDRLPQNNTVAANDNRFTNTVNQPVKYCFNNEGYCEDFECQKLFNNFTKRKTYEANSKELLINPECLGCNYIR